MKLRLVKFKRGAKARILFRVRPSMRAKLACKSQDYMFQWSLWRDGMDYAAAGAETRRLNREAAQARLAKSPGGKQVVEYVVRLS